MRAAVLGRPVGHSLSPLLHRAAYTALGLTDWTYDALDIGAEDLPVLLAGLGPEWRGFSVTMPCKRAAVQVADEVDALPRLLGAANTLTRLDSGGWRADNTDVAGLGTALRAGGIDEVQHA
ncbi:shikimate dehydrogenase, partial [Modestobacter versicolor]